MLFIDPGGPEVNSPLSLWESKEHAETYDRVTYPELLKTLANVTRRHTEGTNFSAGLLGLPQDSHRRSSRPVVHHISDPRGRGIVADSAGYLQGF